MRENWQLPDDWVWITPTVPPRNSLLVFTTTTEQRGREAGWEDDSYRLDS